MNSTSPSNRQWFEIRAQADGEAPVEIYVYDAIYDSGCEFYGGVCPAAFVEATSPYRDRNVTLRINSPGGSVFAGAAIANYLRTFPHLSAVVDGLAASAASLIFMAAPKERRSMGVSSFLMIHEPSGFAFGPAAIMEKMATDLRKISDDIAALYASDTGKSLEQAKAWMEEETWFTAEDARTAGFTATVTDQPPAQMNFDLSHFRHPPAALGQTNNTRMNTNVTACGCQSTAARSNPTPPAEDAAAIRAERDALKAENERLKNSDASARKARAVAAVDAAIGTGALPAALREAMIARYQEDEEGTITALSALRPPGPGVAPIRAAAAISHGSAAHSIRNRISEEPDARKRLNMLVSNFDALAGAGS
jgi:ATP-dependent Clp protease protease subunit